MKIRNILLLGLVGVLFIGLIGCDKEDDYDIEYNDDYPLSGTWWVTYKVLDLDGTILYLSDYSKLYVYNTANAEDSVWVDDDHNFWQYKVKAHKDSDNTFSVNNGWDREWNDPTTIANGKVVNNDSIYMELEWASDSGTVYICSGRRYDGFGE